MVKAKKVKGIRCDVPAVENARRIIEVRLDEMMAFAPYVHQPDNIDAIHDLRISAKRLRYTLEMFKFAFPKGLHRLIKEVKAVQKSIGEMRDADVMIARVNQILDEGNAARSAHLLDIATATERGTVSQRRHRLKSAVSSPALPRDELAYYTLIAHRTDDSIDAYQQFLATWDEMMASDFPGRLRRFTGIDPELPESVDGAAPSEPAEEDQSYQAAAEDQPREHSENAVEQVEDLVVGETPAREQTGEPAEVDA